MKVHKWNSTAQKKDTEDEKFVKDIAMVMVLSFIPPLIMMLFA